MNTQQDLAEQLKIAIRKDDKSVELCTVVLFQNQTTEEQLSEETKEHNGIGFTAFDARKMTYYANWILSGKRLTGKYLEDARSKLMKYANQLTRNLAPIKCKIY